MLKKNFGSSHVCKEGLNLEGLIFYYRKSRLKIKKAIKILNLFDKISNTLSSGTSKFKVSDPFSFLHRINTSGVKN